MHYDTEYKKKLHEGMKWLKQVTPLAVGSHTQRAQNLPLVLQQVTKLDNFALAMMHLISKALFLSCLVILIVVRANCRMKFKTMKLASVGSNK